jgi:hypothetical protein
LSGDVVATEGDCFLSIFVNRRDRVFATAGKTNSDIGMAALARAIDHTAHDSYRERLYTGIL